MKAVGLDIGTSTICTIVIDLTNGNVIESVSCENDASYPAEYGWESLQDPNRIVSICFSQLDKMFDEYNDVASIGISNQMHGILYVGGGQAKSALATWQDGRGNLISDDGVSYARQMSEATSTTAATGFGLVTMLHDARKDMIPSDADAICTIGDYIGMVLCSNNYPVMHQSNAAGLGGFDLARGKFSTSLPTYINTALLPNIECGETVIGKYRNVPVCCAVGDNQASVFGALGSDVSAVINIGTGSQISAISNTPIYYDNGLECRPYIGGKYLSVGSALCGGYSYQLLRDFFMDIAKMLGVASPNDLYERMNEYAEQALLDDSRLIVDTRFKGTRQNPSLRGSISGISVDKFTPGALCLGILEGIICELLELSGNIRPALVKGQRLAASGGGVRKSAIIRRVLKERFEMEVATPLCKEEAAYGSALISSVAAKILTFDEARALIQYENRI